MAASIIPRLSASVVLLRRKTATIIVEGAPPVVEQPLLGQDFEVLLTLRSSKLNSFSSFYVFPGGVVDDADFKIAEAYIHGHDAPTSSETAAARDRAINFVSSNVFHSAAEESCTKITASRELFEEVRIRALQ